MMNLPFKGVPPLEIPEFRLVKSWLNHPTWLFQHHLRPLSSLPQGAAFRQGDDGCQEDGESEEHGETYSVEEGQTSSSWGTPDSWRVFVRVSLLFGNG